MIKRKYIYSNAERAVRYREAHPKIARIHALLNADRTRPKGKKVFPLKEACEFATPNDGLVHNHLEHAHLDYEDEGFNYITACRKCHKYADYNKVGKNSKTHEID